ncbi:hypothetical protein CJ667_07155 [Aliarcobacter cryaerophilus]|nr:hypothetical protein CJ667_07155 [Aliarcobacter cryaerophilus]
MEIRKPYLLILSLLLELEKINKEEAYLTKTEFYELFKVSNNFFKSYRNINVELALNIIERRKNNFLDIQKIRVLAYDITYLRNSSLLTFESSDYTIDEDFAFGLSKEYGVISKIKWLLRDEIREDVCVINENLSDKENATEWAKFLNNQERFNKWKENAFINVIYNELGESGKETGIENDSSDEEIFTTPFNPDEISIQTKAVVLEGLLRRIKKNEINLKPAFQRKTVWDIERKSRLIESMMLNIPLPMFYVSSDKNNNWTVVDGLQRLSTIKEFILGNNDNNKNEYDGKGFKLRKLEFWRDLEGFNIHDSEFPGKPYNNIMETELSFTIINPDTPEEVKRNIFKRINTGGMPLTSQEIRHALYQGDSTILLEELVGNEYFLNAVEKIDDTRMSGRELILRFLSFYLRDHVHYIKDSSMDNHLSTTMRIINILNKLSFEKLQDEFKNEKNLDLNNLYMSIKKVSIKEIKKDFELAMIRNKQLFGSHTFRKSFPGKRRTSINKTLFEVFSNLLLNLDENKFSTLLKHKNEFLLEYKEKFLLTTEFSNMIGRDSHKMSSVKVRYSILSEMINKYT